MPAAPGTPATSHERNSHADQNTPHMRGIAYGSTLLLATLLSLCGYAAQAQINCGAPLPGTGETRTPQLAPVSSVPISPGVAPALTLTPLLPPVNTAPLPGAGLAKGGANTGAPGSNNLGNNLGQSAFRTNERLKATIYQQAIDTDLSNRLDQLLAAALANAPGTDSIETQLNKYSSASARGKGGIKDLGLNYFGLPRGFDFSEEGARVVLNQNSKVKSLEAAECLKQQRVDQLHSAIVSSLFEMATGLGCKNTAESQNHIKRGLVGLDQLVGRQESDRTLDMLVAWSKNVQVPESVFQQPKWDMMTYQQKAAMTTDLAFKHDTSMIALDNRLHGYADHSKTMRASAKVVEGTVSALTVFGPGFGTAIAAQAAGASWGMANGGSEESKLMKELYFEKRIESRRRTLNNDAQLALLNYREALQTNNAPLLLCSESMIAQLIGAVGLQQVLPVSASFHGTFINHPIQTAATGSGAR